MYFAMESTVLESTPDWIDMELSEFDSTLWKIQLAGDQNLQGYIWRLNFNYPNTPESQKVLNNHQNLY